MTARPFASRPRLRRLLMILGLALATGVLLVAMRRPILGGLARAWIVDDAPARSDAIVVLGGGVTTRPFAAAELYRTGLAPEVLITDVGPPPPRFVGILPSDTELMRIALTGEGVPEAAIQVVGGEVTSTWDEVLAIQTWVLARRPRNIMVVTNEFHTRRTRWMFHKMLRHSGVTVRVVAAPNHRYGASDWWQDEEGLIDFQNEIVKYVYYRFRY